MDLLLDVVSKSELNIEQSESWKKISMIMTFIWLPFGAFLWVGAILQVVASCLTIIGFPVAMVVAKSLGTYFNPVNKQCVSLAVKEELDRKKAQAAVEQHLTLELPANYEG